MIKQLFILLFFLNSEVGYSQLQWQKVGDTPNDNVRTLFSDSVSLRLFIGGDFKFISNIPMNGVAQWDGIELLSMNCGIGGCGNNFCFGVHQFEKFQNSIYAIFSADSIGCRQINHFAKWDGTNWIDQNQGFWLGNSSVSPYTLFNLDSILLIAGGFDSIPGKSVNGLIKFDGTNSDTVFICSLFTNSYLLIHPFIKYNQELYAQNLLIDTSGSMQIFSKWNGHCWEKVPGVFSSYASAIYKFIEFQGEMYVAGGFDKNHDPLAPGHGIARWNGNRWDSLAGGVELNNPNYLALIEDMVVYHNELYVVGVFDKAGLIPAKNIAKWDGTKWCSLGNQIDGGISCIAVYHDSLFIGGRFRTIDGDSISHLAKAFPGTYSDSCSSPIGIPELHSTTFDVYPNPATNEIIIDIKTGFGGIHSIQIVNSIGQLMYNQPVSQTSSKVELNTSSWSPGIYFIQVQSEKGIVVKKVSKQ